MSEELSVIRFSCRDCGLIDAEAEVRFRRPGEDVVDYLEGPITAAVALRHQILSFCCEASSFQNLMIPVPEDGDIGMKLK